MTMPLEEFTPEQRAKLAEFEAAPYPPEVAVCRDGCEVCPPRAPARSASPAPDETEVERAVEAGQVAVRQMAYDWYCPSDERRPRHTCPDCIAEIAVRAALAARVPADDPAAAERRCSATIWPSYANQWIQCPGFIRRGRCSAYGAQHDSPNGISR